MSDALIGSALLQAYAEYLERMYEQSEELTPVDVFTVPQTVDADSPTLAEWADVGWHLYCPLAGALQHNAFIGIVHLLVYYYAF